MAGVACGRHGVGAHTNLPYDTPPMTLRRLPSDFAVVERLNPGVRSGFTASWSAESPHAVYELTKTSLTTPEAIQSLARDLRAKPDDVSYAGLKDKHAHTIQNISAIVARGDHASALPRVREGRGWTARLIAWSRAPISSESIDGNGFSIVVRGLSAEACEEMDRRALLLQPPPAPQKKSAKGAPPARPPAVSLLVMNYFGDQRFGSARHGKGWIARALIAGDFDTALKLAIATPARKDTGRTREFTRLAAEKWGQWKHLARALPACPERKPIELLAGGAEMAQAFAALPAFLQSMYVEAYQSHLWNESARRVAKMLSPEGPGTGDQTRVLRSSDAYGEMLFPVHAIVNDLWRSQEMPLLAPKTIFDGPWAEAAKEALAEEGVAKADLKIPGLARPFFGEARRALFVQAERYAADASEPDELEKRPNRLKRTVRFDLPRGSYATVVLRALGQ